MKFAKQTLMTGAILAVLALPARADLITFDPTGTPGAGGNISNVALFDYSPGSALAVGANSSTGIGSAFTTYFQANLGTVLGANSEVLFANGGGSNFFTAVAGFGETVLTCASSPGGFCSNATFGFDSSNTTNFFDIFKVPSTADNLTGVGFTGTAILSGQVIGSGFSSNFALSSTTATPLDQSPNGNQWAGTSTVSGTGASDITVRITFADPNYFPDLTTGSIITFSAFNTSQILPFQQVDPSRCVSNGTADCAIQSLVGTFNGAPGSGPDILFQADANQSFTRATVPEPGTLALLGLGMLMVSGFVGKRQKRQ